MSLRQFAVASTAVLALGLSVSGCQKASDASSGGSGSSGAKTPWTIGVVMAKSGFLGPVDTPASNALRLQAAEMNQSGGIDGHPVELKFFDTQSQLAKYAPGAQQMLAAGVKALVVSCDYDTASPAAQAAQAKNVVVIAPCVGDPIFGPEGGLKIGFSMGDGTPGEASIMAEFANSKGWKNAVLLKDTTLKYTQNQCDIVAKRLGQLGDKVIASYNYKQGDDVTETVSKIRAGKKPDVVFNCGYSPGGATVAKELRDGGVPAPIISGFGMDGDFWTSGVPGLKDYYVVTYVSKNGDDPDPAVNKFAAAYKTKFGAAPSVGSFVTGAATLQSLKVAYGDAKTWDGKKITAAMEAFKDVPTLAGPTSFSPALHINVKRPMSVLEVVDGKLKFVERRTPQQVVEAP